MSNSDIISSLISNQRLRSIIRKVWLFAIINFVLSIGYSIITFIDWYHILHVKYEGYKVSSRYVFWYTIRPITAIFFTFLAVVSNILAIRGFRYFTVIYEKEDGTYVTKGFRFLFYALLIAMIHYAGILTLESIRHIWFS